MAEKGNELSWAFTAAAAAFNRSQPIKEMRESFLLRDYCVHLHNMHFQQKLSTKFTLHFPKLSIPNNKFNDFIANDVEVRGLEFGLKWNTVLRSHNVPPEDGWMGGCVQTI